MSSDYRIICRFISELVIFVSSLSSAFLAGLLELISWHYTVAVELFRQPNSNLACKDLCQTYDCIFRQPARSLDITPDKCDRTIDWPPRTYHASMSLSFLFVNMKFCEWKSLFPLPPLVHNYTVARIIIKLPFDMLDVATELSQWRTSARHLGSSASGACTV